jgi:sialic acid synthase SpsE
MRKIEFFADIGSNWRYGNPDNYHQNAIDLIKIAADIGCTGVKFQLFKADRLWSSKFPVEREAARLNELPETWIPFLSSAARKEGLLFGLSVFHPELVNRVTEYVDYFKIASFEIVQTELFQRMTATGKRLQVSLGQMNSPQEIFDQIDETASGEYQIDLLHCISKYPAEPADCNMAILQENKFINGWSDHTTDLMVIFAAVCCGADVIEVHLKPGRGSFVQGYPEEKHSWDPGLLSVVIKNCKDLVNILGDKNWVWDKHPEDYFRYKSKNNKPRGS